MDLPQQWANENDNIYFAPVLSQPNKDWQGRKGFVHEAILSVVAYHSLFLPCKSKHKGI
jgi:NAD(P)H-flavin reductase